MASSWAIRGEGAAEHLHLAPGSDRQEGDVVVTIVGDELEQPVGDLGQRAGAHARGHLGEPFETPVQWLLPALDQAVRVHDQDRPGAEPLLRLGSGQVEGQTERHRSTTFEEPRRTVGLDHEGGWVAGGGVAQLVPRRVEQQREDRREEGAVHASGEPIERSEDRVRFRHRQRERAPGAADLPHRRRGLEPVARDVADGECHGAVRPVDDVVPVAAHVHPARGREVASVDVDGGRVACPFGHQVALQRHGGLVLDLVGARSFQGDPGLVRERADELGLLGRRLPSLLPEVDGQRADRLALGDDRHRVQATPEVTLGREPLLEPRLPFVRGGDPQRPAVPIDVGEHGCGRSSRSRTGAGAGASHSRGARG